MFAISKSHFVTFLASFLAAFLFFSAWVLPSPFFDRRNHFEYGHMHRKTSQPAYEKEGWYTDSPAGFERALAFLHLKDREGWYQDSAAVISEAIKSGKDEEGWYRDSPAGIANSLAKGTERWHADPAVGLDKSIPSKHKEGWYTDSPAGIDASISKDKEGWYTDSPAAVSKSLSSKDKGGWYTDSPAGLGKTLHNKDKEGWYTDSPAGIDQSLAGEKEEGWYTDSAVGVDKSLRDGPHDVAVSHNKHQQGSGTEVENPELKRSESKEEYETALRTWIYANMRSRPLKEAAERSSHLFQFTVHPRDDTVDRWHVPVEIREEYSHSNDARRVSLLNYYLMLTGREVRSAKELGFTPTADEPGLVEENEVGFGYVYRGQHQAHCINFVADAVERGRDALSDFYLRHTVHCLGLMKAYSAYLTQKEPLGMVGGTGRRAREDEDPSTP